MDGVTGQSADRTPIPDGWREKRLGEVARERIQRANSAQQADVFSVTKHAGIVRSLEYFERQVFSRDTRNYKVVRRGDLAYATIHLDEGSLGILRNEEAGIISPMYTVIEADRVHAEPEYLFSLMKLPQMVLKYRRIGEGTVHRRKSISFERLGRLRIVLPPLPEQKHILTILDSIDDAVERTEGVIAATEHLRDALLHELLTRGVPGQHSEWKEAPGIGTIPACWDVVRLGDVVESTTYGTNASLDGSGSTPVLRMGNLQNGQIDLSDLRRADLSSRDFQDLNLVRGDILFNRTNSLALVGKVAVVRDLPQPISFASYLVRLRTHKNRADPFWLTALLLSPSCQSRIRQFATPGVSQANINPTSLKSLMVPLPPLAEQKAIAVALDGVDEAIEQGGMETEMLRSLKASAADALLTGRVRVPLGG